MHPHTSPQYKALLIISHKWRVRHITGGGEVKRKLYCVPQWHNIYPKFRCHLPNGLVVDLELLREAQTQVNTDKMVITEI